MIRKNTNLFEDLFILIYIYIYSMTNESIWVVGTAAHNETDVYIEEGSSAF